MYTLNLRKTAAFFIASFKPYLTISSVILGHRHDGGK